MKKSLVSLILVCLPSLFTLAQINAGAPKNAEASRTNPNKSKAKTEKATTVEPKEKAEKTNPSGNGNSQVDPRNINLPPSATQSQTKIEIAPPSTNNHTPSTTTGTKWVRRRVKRSTNAEDGLTERTKIVKKRVLKGVKKVRGYRVLIYSGGNTRIARQEAEKSGQSAKIICPEEPVYVHFYSPRWMCQVGNFTDPKKAQRVLRKLKKEGFKTAIIMRTMVTVETMTDVSKGDDYEEIY